jgi:hypothetical protein
MKESYIVLLTIASLVLLILLYGVVVALLWNACLVGAIDGVRDINYLQSLGIVVLFQILLMSKSSIKKNKEDDSNS